MAPDPAARAGGAADTISAAELSTACETLLVAIVSEGGAREHAERHAPGGPDNPDTTVRGWLRYYQQLHRIHAVLVGHATDGRSSEPRSALDAHLASALSAALVEEPVPVQFADGVVRMVYPKSYHALAWLDSLDRQYLANAHAALALADVQGASAEELRVHALAPLVSSLAVRLWLWILTHPGPGLPFDESKVTADPPRWTRNVAPEDLIKMFEAHLQIHQERLAIIARAFPSDGQTTTRLPLAGFIGALAHESGQDARLLMRFHSLGKLFATSVTAAEGAREARRRAEEHAGATT